MSRLLQPLPTADRRQRYKILPPVGNIQIRAPAVARRTAQIAPLTSIRGLAAWWVVIYHFREYLPATHDGWIYLVASQGFYAVDLFFILSGFVIYLNYSALFQRLTAASLRKFGQARFARVYPLHLFMILLFLLNPLAVACCSHGGLTAAQADGRYDPVDYVLNLLLVQNWGFRDHLSWNIPAWSISTEFAAYLIFPFAAWLANRRLQARWCAVCAIAGCLAALALAFWGAGAHRLGDDITRLGLLRCLLEFFIGTMIGKIYQAKAPSPYEQYCYLVGAAALIAACVVTPIPDYLVVPLALTLIIFGITTPRGTVGQILSISPLIFLGNISYSTYLCHFFVKDWVKFLLAGHGVSHWEIFIVFVVSTLLMSMALYWWIELPLRRMLRAPADRALRVPPLPIELGTSATAPGE